MTVSLLIDFQDEAGWYDASDLVKNCVRTENACAEDFSHAVDSCSLTLVYDSLLLSKLATARGDSVALIQIDGVPYFSGRIPPTTKFETGGTTVDGDVDIEDIEIEVLDYSSLLDRQVKDSDAIAWEHYHICDPAAPSTSIVHQLLALCGVTGSQVAITQTISIELRAFTKGSGDGTIGDILNTLLYEYGYTYRFDRTGRIVLVQWIYETLSPTMDIDELIIMADLMAEKIAREYDGCKLYWFGFIEKSQAMVYLEDLPIGDDNRYSGYPIQPGYLYPVEANVEETWWEYQDRGVSNKVVDGRVVKDKNFSQIVLTKNHTLDDSFEAGVAPETTIYGNKRARLTWRNGEATSKKIYWAAIYADVVYLGSANEIEKMTAASPKKVDEYTAEYIHDETSAGRLASARADIFYKGAWRFSFQSETEIPVGTIGTLTDPYSGLAGTVMVIQSSFDPETGIYEVKAISIADVTIAPTASRMKLLPSPPKTKTESIETQLQNVPSFTDLEEGYESSGATKTPVVPVILLCEGVAPHTIEILIDHQVNLGNAFSHFKVQVSDNQLQWYKLRTDGVDWKGDLNGATITNLERVIHCGIPHEGAIDNPTGKHLYYRASRVNKNGLESEYSAVADATEPIILAGSLGLNAIFASNISASVMETILLKAYFLYLGFTGGDILDPEEGDVRIYADAVKIAFEMFTRAVWAANRRIQIGGTDSFGNFLPFSFCRGLLGSTGVAPVNDPLPDKSFYRFNFDDSLKDQFGNDPWSVTGVVGYSANKFEGTKSLTQGSTDYLTLYWNNIWRCGSSATICGRMYLTDANSQIQVGLYYNGQNQIRFTLNNTSISIQAWKSGVFSSKGAATDPIAGSFHLLCFMYDEIENKAILRFDDIEYSLSPTGSWGSSANGELHVSFIDGGHQCYIDDLIFSPIISVDPEIFYQHLLRNRPWDPGSVQADLHFIPSPGGRVIIAGTNVKRKVLTEEGYTITEDDGFSEIECKTGAADQTIVFPALKKSIGRIIDVSSAHGSGAGEVVLDGEGDEPFIFNGASYTTIRVGLPDQHTKVIGTKDGWKIIGGVVQPVALEPDIGGGYHKLNRTVSAMDVSTQAWYSSPYIWDVSSLLPDGVRSVNVKVLVALAAGVAEISGNAWAMVWDYDSGAYSVDKTYNSGAWQTLPYKPASSTSRNMQALIESRINIGASKKLYCGMYKDFSDAVYCYATLRGYHFGPV